MNAQNIHAVVLAAMSLLSNADTKTLVKLVNHIKENPAEDDWAEHLLLSVLATEGLARGENGDDLGRHAVTKAINKVWG